MKLEQARTYAVEIVELLKPACIRIEIAGGIRRRKLVPHDIELVAVPKFGVAFQDTLFGDGGTENLLNTRLQQLIDDRVIEHAPQVTQHRDGREFQIRAPWNDKYHRCLYRGTQLDVFSVLQPATWGVIFTLRTGDAEFSQWLVSQGWKHGLFFDDGVISKITRKADGSLVTSRYVKIGEEKLYLDDINAEPMATPEEADVFRVLGIECPPPEKRITHHFENSDRTAYATGYIVNPGPT